MTDFRALLAAARENHRKLDNCPRHYFPPRAEGYRLGRAITCSVCGGEMSLVDAGHYVRGYVAAGGDARTVWPDWSGR